MGRASFRTPLGEIWLWGERERFESDLPVIVVLPGALCRPDALWFRMQDRFPEAAVFAAQLPGNECPVLSETSVEAFAKAFGYVIETAFGGRPVLVCGESIGGTVALALANPWVSRVVFDPPLRTADLWPLRNFLTQMYAERPHHRPFFENLFGFDGENLRDIDFLPLVRSPARIVIGAEPLMPERPLKGNFLPSLVGEHEREVLSARPDIHLTTVMNAGHVLIWFEDTVIDVLKRELQKAVARWERGSAKWADEPAPETDT